MPVPWGDVEEVEVLQMHDWNIVEKPSKAHVCCPEAQRLSKKGPIPLGPGPITWTVSDIAKAARLLTVPPLSTSFEDEQEMRRVYTLIYDTFRYKGILNQALNGISFYASYASLEEKSTLVWLLFFDLYHRSFKKREPSVVKLAEKLFAECNLTCIEDALWQQRIKIAAAISRLRIKNSALRLCELLPKHLKDDRINSDGKKGPVTCWINPNNVKNEQEIVNILVTSLNLELTDNVAPLAPNCFKWDTMCPSFLSFHHSLRTALAKSSLVQKHKIIVQDRSFCLGPATFGKIILDLELAGTVIQSHVNSPRTTAYLATLLLQNAKITNLLVFSAGTRKGEYESYFQQLGMTNVSIYSEKLIDIPPDSNCLDRVIAVFATPPNSYSAVSDPIDLVCSRGGDLSLLEILTESEITEEGKTRVAKILEEQKKTLKFAMSRPQIQLVLYETHSELEVENDEMVQRAMKEINKLAKLRHAALQGKLQIPSSHSDILSQEIQEINNNESIRLDADSISSKRISITSKPSFESFDQIFKDILVPQCDIFDKPDLPDLCPNSESCLRLAEEGCYLALLQRKEVIKLDNKYMIQMAESRGLFGNNSSVSGRPKGSRGSKHRKQDKRPASSTPTKTKRKSKHIELDRIAAPTQASSMRMHSNLKSAGVHDCPRNKLKGEEDSLAKAMDLLQKTTKSGNVLSPTNFDDFQTEQYIDTLQGRGTSKIDLSVLRRLTNSREGLEDLISCGSHFQCACEDRRRLLLRQNITPPPMYIKPGTPNRCKSPSKPSSASKNRSSNFNLERISAPTYNSITRNKLLQEKSSLDYGIIGAECETCRRRNMEP